MTYLSDWREAEEGAAYAHAMNPDCTLEHDCPAADDGHILNCAKSWNEQRKRIRDWAEQRTADD